MTLIGPSLSERSESRHTAFVGLGNPGAQYRDTRHNIGFMVIDYWLQALNLEPSSVSDVFQAATGTIDKHNVILIKPMTFMNRSGEAVREVCRRYRLSNRDFVVICDDVNLPFGTLRLRGSGSDGGNNGLGSIIDSLGSEDFCRLRIGVGGPASDMALVDYVLEPFSSDEQRELPPVIDRACKQLGVFLNDGWQMAASRHNGQ